MGLEGPCQPRPFRNSVVEQSPESRSPTCQDDVRPTELQHRANLNLAQTHSPGLHSTNLWPPLVPSDSAEVMGNTGAPQPTPGTATFSCPLPAAATGTRSRDGDRVLPGTALSTAARLAAHSSVSGAVKAAVFCLGRDLLTPSTLPSESRALPTAGSLREGQQSRRAEGRAAVLLCRVTLHHRLLCPSASPSPCSGDKPSSCQFCRGRLPSAPGPAATAGPGGRRLRAGSRLCRGDPITSPRYRSGTGCGTAEQTARVASQTGKEINYSHQNSSGFTAERLEQAGLVLSCICA